MGADEGATVPTSCTRTGTSFTFLITMSPISSGACTWRIDQTQEELVIAAQQSGGIDNIRVIGGVQNVLHGDVRAQHLDGSGVI